MRGKLSKITKNYKVSDLSYNGHVKVISKKVSQKRSVIAKLAKVISKHRINVLIKTLNLN